MGVVQMEANDSQIWDIAVYDQYPVNDGPFSKNNLLLILPAWLVNFDSQFVRRISR